MVQDRCCVLMALTVFLSMSAPLRDNSWTIAASLLETATTNGDVPSCNTLSPSQSACAFIDGMVAAAST